MGSYASTVAVDKSLLKEVVGVLDKYNSKRPRSDRNLDHVRADEATLAKRATILGQVVGNTRKKLLFLGDNDLTSVAFGLAQGSLRTTVIDVDRRILDFIDMVAAAEGLSINLVEHDIKNPFKKDNLEEQDIVFCDPPYTPKAVQTWLIRAVELTLKRGRKKRRKRPEFLSQKEYLLCYGYTDRATERGLAVQEVITNLRLILTEKFRDFNHYYGGKSIGSRSDLYRLQPTPGVDLRSVEIARGVFYTGQKRT